MDTKLTERDILSAIAEGTLEDLDPDAVAAWAEKKLAQLDNKAAKQRERSAAKRAEGDALTEVVLSFMTDEFQSIAEVAEQVQETNADVTVAKVQYRLSQAAKDGTLEKGEKQVETDGRKRRVVAYRLAGVSAPVGVS